MKILFSPSEGKSIQSNDNILNENSFIFKELYPKRKEALEYFQNFIKSQNDENLKKFFETKSDKELIFFKEDIFSKPTIEAIKRYNGVAYEMLDFINLNKKAQEYILNNVLIFSNLFGPIMAKDLIPFYKFKQGKKIDNFNIEKFYKENFSSSIDNLLKDELVIDLRAKFYEKFYTLKQTHLSFIFLKNSKILSHYTKAYRGKILKILALHDIQTKEELFNNLPNELKIKDIKIQGLKEEIVLEIL
ncbi:YaaA family protein [Campylobacter peloridis]|uniref:YaaA family protein n=2 Tax=Campylobacter peloridis TaxID=488546 RepID=UPI001C734949|nr:peroxide stress protein YaaA [Campylobacter peloridis]MBX1886015.1 peroxide stress protein YaaA [Campylobacter peloridis]